MFDIGATEVIVLAVVAIVVVGPRDLPKMLRTVGQFVGKARSMAREFQQHFNEAADEAGLDEVRKGIASVEETARSGDFGDPLSAFSDAGKDIKDELDKPVDMGSEADCGTGEASPSDDGSGDTSETSADVVASDDGADTAVQAEEAGAEPEPVSDLALDQDGSSRDADGDDETKTAEADVVETPAKTVAS